MSDAEELRERFQALIRDNGLALLGLLEADSKFKEMQQNILELSITGQVETELIVTLEELKQSLIKIMVKINSMTVKLVEYRDRL